MSRIHEALKRAEQERSASQGGNTDAPQTPSSENVGVMPETAASGVVASSGAAAMPALSSQFSFDTLLARCAQSNWSPDTNTMLFFNGDEQTDGTEEFRTLRSRLYQMREQRPMKKLLVTSSLPKEGKTFVAANLAQVMVRQHGRRALIIDADLRAPRMHSALGASMAPGMSEYLLGESDEFGVMQRGSMENLFFIPSGRGVANPAELVANGRLKFLLNRVEPLFDWIIIDSPPAVPVSDASLLANFVDGVVMVVRSNATPFDIAKRARSEFRDEQLVGVVLNGIDADDSPYSRYYYNSHGKPAEKAENAER